MPLYEYQCSAHGVFELHRGVGEFASPAACPDCHQPSARILSLPGVAFVERAERVARDRNEQSRHEPGVVQRRLPPAAEPSAPTWQARPSGGLPWAVGHG